MRVDRICCDSSRIAVNTRLADSHTWLCRLNVSFEVLEGRDIDFGIMLLADGEEVT